MSAEVGDGPTMADRGDAVVLEVSAQFEQLLVEERQAATSADVERLVALQPPKRALLEQLRQAGAPDAELEKLGERARMNVVLIRQLVQCLGGLVSVAGGDGTYDAHGKRGAAGSGTSRGAL